MTATMEFTTRDPIEVRAVHPKYNVGGHTVDITQDNLRFSIWFSIRDKDAARKADLLAAAISKVLSDDWEDLCNPLAAAVGLGVMP